MKKYTTILLCALICLAACSKLEVKPRGEIYDRKDAYTNPILRNQALAGVYSYLLRIDTWGRFIPIGLESCTDVEMSRTASASVEVNSHTPKDLNTTWATFYQGINAANEFIYFSNLYNEGKNVQQIAEARFLRAYFYFTLVRLFGDVPFRTEPMFDLNKTDIARTSAVDIYNFIVTELNEIEPRLGQPTAIDYGHISRTAAQAALADVYLNLGGHLMLNRLPADSTKQLMHQRAAYWCEQVLANPAHDIAKTDYVTVFKNQTYRKNNVAEQVWELQFDYMRDVAGYRCDGQLGKYNGMTQRSYGADGSIVYNAGGYVYQAYPIRKLYSKLNADDATNDVRQDWNCPIYRMANSGCALNEPKYDTKYVDLEKNPMDIYRFFVGKWRTIFTNHAAEAADQNYSGTRLSIYRIADVHLMYAEALNEGDQNQLGAIEHINKVRARANASLITGTPSKDEVFELIVDERARELCFEGKRRFDLIRWNLYKEKFMAMQEEYLEANIPTYKDNVVAAFSNFDPNAHYIMPIPQAEISRNALIPQSEQNEGWGGSRKWR